MKPADVARADLVRQWLRKAEVDLDAAESLLSSEPLSWYPSCYFCQQSAEKSIKAFLTWREVHFPKTHNIAGLLSLVAKVSPDLTARLKSAASLTPYGVEFRYPGDMPEPTRAEAEEALALAQTAREAILAALPPLDTSPS